MLPSCPYKYLSHPPTPLWAWKYFQRMHILFSDLEHPVASWQPSRQYIWQLNRVEKYALSSSWNFFYVFRIRVAKNYYFCQGWKNLRFLIRVINIIFSGSELEKIEFLAKFSLPELEKLWFLRRKKNDKILLTLIFNFNFGRNWFTQT